MEPEELGVKVIEVIENDDGSATSGISSGSMPSR